MPAPCLRIASAQMKFRRSVADHVEWITHTIRQVAQDGVKAVLFPECAVTGYIAISPNCARKPSDRLCRDFSGRALGSLQRLVGCPTFGANSCAIRCWCLTQEAGSVPLFEDSPDTAGRPFLCAGKRAALFRVGGVDCTAILCLSADIRSWCVCR